MPLDVGLLALADPIVRLCRHGIFEVDSQAVTDAVDIVEVGGDLKGVVNGDVIETAYFNYVV